MPGPAVTPEPAVGPAAARRRRRRGVLAVAVVVLGVVIVRTQLLDLLTVSSDSMSPTLCIGDTVILSRLRFGATIAHDDIVTFRDPDTGTEAIKRVVGLAGEKVSIVDGQFTIGGQPIDEPWVDRRTIDGVYFGPVIVPADSVFLMGDHREISIDSRHFGAVAVDDLDGRLLAAPFGGCG